MEEKDTLAEADSSNGHLIQSTYIKPQARKLHDPAVTWEEYNYYAQRTREYEKTITSPKLQWLTLLTRKKESALPPSESNGGTAQAAQIDLNLAKQENRVRISDEEWVNASRAYRTASWGACFYLVSKSLSETPSKIVLLTFEQITTDILGPFAVPYAIGTLGYGPGIALFTVFGFFAGYSGYLIWHVYMGVDSYEFPARNYGDLAFRTWGTIARHFVNFFQAIALLLLLGQVTILFGGNILELSKLQLCYIVCPLIFVLAGFFLTQVRSLRN